MKRLVVAVAVAALGLAACGAGNEVEATVNGTEIMTADVEALLFEVTDADRTAQRFATNLSVAIQWEAIDQRINGELDYTPSEDDIDTEVRRIVIGQGLLDLESFLTQTNLSEAALRRTARHNLVDQHLQETLGPTIEQPTVEEAEQELEDNPDLWVIEVCSSHILVTTSTQAEDALGRIEAGEDFAIVAADVSLDTGSAAAGGSLGCADPANYVAEFAQAAVTAPIGEVVGPVQTEFGSHLILVESTTLAPVEQVQEALAERRLNEAVDAWFQDAVELAAVVVDESRGTWVTDPLPRVVPPPELS